MAHPASPAALTGLACVLHDFGWRWSRDLLEQCAKWLEAQGIVDRVDLDQLELGDLSNVDRWSPEVGTSCARWPNRPTFMYALHCCVFCQVQAFLMRALAKPAHLDVCLALLCLLSGAGLPCKSVQGPEAEAQERGAAASSFAQR